MRCSSCLSGKSCYPVSFFGRQQLLLVGRRCRKFGSLFGRSFSIGSCFCGSGGLGIGGRPFLPRDPFSGGRRPPPFCRRPFFRGPRRGRLFFFPPFPRV